MLLFASLLTMFLIVFNGIIFVTALQIVGSVLISKISKPVGGLCFICVIAHAVDTSLISLIWSIVLIFIWNIVLLK